MKNKGKVKEYLRKYPTQRLDLWIEDRQEHGGTIKTGERALSGQRYQ